MGSLGTTPLAVVFILGGVATWVAGVFLSDATDVLDDRFGLGEALGGLILLGVAGTLPEIAIASSAALAGHLGLATGNLLGGIAVQTVVLALLDAVSGSKTPLTTLSSVLEPIMEALFVVILVTLALLGPLLPSSVAVGPVSPISIVVVVVWLLGLVVLNRLRKSERWSVRVETVSSAMQTKETRKKRNGRFTGAGTPAVILVFGAAAVVTLVAGVVLETSGDSLATNLGINGVVFGATVLAAVTAIPEISSGIQAVRLDEVGLAMGDIFGGNQVQMTLFLVADLLAGKPVLQTVSTSSAWLGGVGVVVTAVYGTGLVIRPPRKRLGLGPDSWLVLGFYVLGIVGLLRLT